MEFCLNSLTKSWKKYQKVLFFQNKTHFFAIRGCFSQMFVLRKRFLFAKGLNWDQSCLWKTSPSRFLLFSPLACRFFFKKFHLLILEELRNLHAKIDTFSVKIDREINFRSWLLFYCIFHPCRHFAIVHWRSQMDKVGFGGGASEQKINFCLKWSKRVQRGPKGSQMIKNS